MNIQLHNVKVVPELSEETTCFTADVHVEGRRPFRATNRGTGGANLYTPLSQAPDSYREMRETVDLLAKRAATLPRLRFDDGYTMPQSLETLIEDRLLDLAL